MVIDTKDVSGWVSTHLRIVVPVACGVLSWYAATRWQAAISHGEVALMVFYFFVSAVSGIASAVLTFGHLTRLGFFD